jgi:hypothetical protein
VTAGMPISWPLYRANSLPPPGFSRRTAPDQAGRVFSIAGGGGHDLYLQRFNGRIGRTFGSAKQHPDHNSDAQSQHSTACRHGDREWQLPPTRKNQSSSRRRRPAPLRHRRPAISLIINQSTGVTITGASGLTGTYNNALSGITVATFTYSGFLMGSSASLNWGDGSTSSGTITGSSSPYSVTGSHTYAAMGTYRIIITVNTGGGSVHTYGTATITIGDGTLSATGTSLTAAGVPLNGTQVATISDGNPGAAAGNLTVLVNWGDSTPPP